MTTHTIPSQQPFEDAFARRLISHLDNAADHLPHDISERLKVARTHALAKRRVLAPAVVSEVAVSVNALVLNGGSERQGLWGWLGSVLPLVALVAGLMAISVMQDDLRANEIASVDAELLTDELPPAAYTDPGFLQFLRSNHAEH